MKFHSSRAVAALFIVALGLPSVVNAAVTNISDGRIVSIDGLAGDILGSNNYSHSAVPQTPFAPFDEHLSDGVSWNSFLGSADTLGAASQTSSISPSLYSGIGNASLDFNFFSYGFNSGTSESIFDIHFSIDSPYVYNFTGNIAAIVSDANGLVANAQALLSTGTGTVIQYFGGNDIFNVSGILEPGAYILYGKAVVEEVLPVLYSPSSGTASFNFALAINPVPEPETYAMFLAGLGLVGVMARRKK